MTSKIRIALLLLIIFTIIATVVANCGSSNRSGITPGLPGGGNDPTGDNPSDYYDPAANLKDVDSLGLVLTDSDGDVFTFSYTGNPPDINVGDIISGSSNGGYLRSVTNVVDTGSSLIITTDQATIDDAVNAAELSTQLDFSSRTNQFARGGMNAAPAGGYIVPLSGEVLYSNGGLTVEVLDGEVIFHPECNIEMRYDPITGLTYLNNTSTGYLNFDFDLKANGTGNFNVSDEKLVHTSAPIPFKIGPVYGTFVVDFFVGFELDGNINNWLKSGIDSTLDVELGAIYQNGSWSPVVLNNHEIVPGTVLGSSNGAVSFAGYVRPEINIYFASNLSPKLTCQSDFDLQGTGELDPNCLEYSLNGSISATLSVDTDILGDNIVTYSAEILNVSEVAGTGSVGDCSSCGNLNIGSISGSADVESGGFALYTVQAQGDSGITYTWSCSPSSAGSFTNPSAASGEFNAANVDSDTDVEISVLVKSDSCPNGVTRKKDIIITTSICPYTVSGIAGPSYLPGLTSGFYSVAITPYSAYGISFSWTCDPSNAGYFLSNDDSLIEFFANPVTDDKEITLEVEVASDSCDPITREKQVTIQKEASSGN